MHMVEHSETPAARSIATAELAWLYENVKPDDVSARIALASIAAQLAVADELAEVRADLHGLLRHADSWSKDGFGVVKMAY